MYKLTIISEKFVAENINYKGSVTSKHMEKEKMKYQFGGNIEIEPQNLIFVELNLRKEVVLKRKRLLQLQQVQ